MDIICVDVFMFIPPFPVHGPGIGCSQSGWCPGSRWRTVQVFHFLHYFHGHYGHDCSRGAGFSKDAIVQKGRVLVKMHLAGQTVGTGYDILMGPFQG